MKVEMSWGRVARLALPYGFWAEIQRMDDIPYATVETMFNRQYHPIVRRYMSHMMDGREMQELHWHDLPEWHPSGEPSTLFFYADGVPDKQRIINSMAAFEAFLAGQDDIAQYGKPRGATW